MALDYTVGMFVSPETGRLVRVKGKMFPKETSLMTSEMFNKCIQFSEMLTLIEQ